MSFVEIVLTKCLINKKINIDFDQLNAYFILFNNFIKRLGIIMFDNTY